MDQLDAGPDTHACGDDFGDGGYADGGPASDAGGSDGGMGFGSVVHEGDGGDVAVDTATDTARQVRMLLPKRSRRVCMCGADEGGCRRTRATCGALLVRAWHVTGGGSPLLRHGRGGAGEQPQGRAQRPGVAATPAAAGGGAVVGAARVLALRRRPRRDQGGRGETRKVRHRE